MPELDEDASAALMHAVGHLAPAGDLFLRIDAGRVLIALALLRDLAGLGDQQARGGALAVIFDCQRIGHQARDRAVAGQGRHDKAVGQRERTELEGLEKFAEHFIIFQGSYRRNRLGIAVEPGNGAGWRIT